MTTHGDARRSYVFFSSQDYWCHNRGHSDLQLSRGLAAERKLLLVNSIGLRMPVPGRSAKSAARIWSKLRSIGHLVRRPEPALPELYVMSPVTLPFYGNRATRSLNTALVGAQVRLVQKAIGIDRPDVIVTIPTAAGVAARMTRRSLTVNRSDKHSTFSEANQEVIAAYEKDLLADADLAVYVSTILMNEERPYVTGSVEFLDHGVDLDLFTPVSAERQPADIIDLPRPIYGFFGGLDDFVVDFDLIRRLADSLDEGSVVLIGNATCDISQLAAHPRVHWLGARRHDEIPSYGSAFDVALMPWLDNEWIRYCNPIKIREYLALGLPVVTTYYPQAEYFSELIGVATSPADFVDRCLDVARNGDGRAAGLRQSAVSGDSWAHRARQLRDLIDHVDAPVGINDHT